ncbi:hypothetical protein KUV89_14895 [Marinobacter hydrocarbonoclasticus]|nr:hypothetical protein [Marinobacter nauticus]
MQPIEVHRQIGGHDIRVVCSMLTGRERVLVDGEEVSNKLSWRMRTVHRFELDGRNMEVDVAISSIWEGRLGIVFRLDGETVGVTRWAFSEGHSGEENPKESQWLEDWRLPGWMSGLFWLPYGALLVLELVATFSGNEAAITGWATPGLLVLGITGLVLMCGTWFRGLRLTAKTG